MADAGGQARGQQPAEGLGGPGGDAVAAPGEEHQHDDHRQGAEQAPLLAQHREGEVGVGLGQEGELVVALPHAQAAPAAGAQTDEGLVDLVRR